MADAISSAIYGAPTQQNAGESTPVVGGVFNRAAVLHTLCDPSLRDETADEKIISSLKNQKDYMRAPRNSLVCRVITEGKGQVENADIVCFPFFSSHIMMPVKAGEQVWVFFEKPGEESGRAFWVSRIAEPLHVEDANFTHGDRRILRDFPVEGTPPDDGSGNADDPRKLKFQNGDVTNPKDATLLGDQDAFVNVITGSKEFLSTLMEPVPRLTKRPGDLVLQGSNNTSITLGTVMGWDVTKRPVDPKSSVATPDKDRDSSEVLKPGVGAIDIVTGRGKYFQDAQTEKSATGKKEGKSPDKSTRPFIEETVIPGVFETDKNVGVLQDEETQKKKGNNRTNPQEGDPDFLMDASRIYASSNSAIDKMLKTGPTGVATAFENPVQEMVGATIAVKSDHIRLVARKSGDPGSPEDVSNESPPTNGTIRIVKEGDPSVDLASIVIESDGTIQISGSKIYIGRKTDDGGVGTGPSPGESQPYVRYQQLEDMFNKLYDALTTFAQNMNQKFSTTATPGFGGPDPALIQAAVDCETFKNDIKSVRDMIPDIQSKRIFGE